VSNCLIYLFVVSFTLLLVAQNIRGLTKCIRTNAVELMILNLPWERTLLLGYTCSAVSSNSCSVLWISKSC